jgi:hypothetical protein
VPYVRYSDMIFCYYINSAGACSWVNPRRAILGIRVPLQREKENVHPVADAPILWHSPPQHCPILLCSSCTIFCATDRSVREQRTATWIILLVYVFYLLLRTLSILNRSVFVRPHSLFRRCWFHHQAHDQALSLFFFHIMVIWVYLTTPRTHFRNSFCSKIVPNFQILPAQCICCLHNLKCPC